MLYHVSSDGNTLTGFVDRGSSGFDASDRVVFTLAIDDSSGTGSAGYTFTLLDNLDHKTQGQLGDNVEGPLPLDLTNSVIATDSSGTNAPVHLGGSISIIDDTPVAQADTANVTPTDVAATVNALFVLDRSGSMGSDGDPGSSISIAKAAILDFASHNNVLSVRILPFSSAAGSASAWFDLTTAAGHTALETFLDPVTGSGNTNYEFAIQTAQSTWTAPPNAADFTNVYFVSDGAPTVRSNDGINDGNPGGIGDPNGLTSQEKAAWEAFLQNPANNIDNAFAIGINTSVSDIDLQEVAYPNTPDETHNVIIVNSATDLGLTLQNTLQGTVTGNVIFGSDNIAGTADDDHFGADGPGYVASLRFDSNGDGVINGSDVQGYTFNGSHLFLNGVDQGAISEVTFTTGHSGDMHFNFLTGAWTYSTPDSVPAQFHELFQYTIVDGDGDATPATGLDITVNKANLAPTITSGATGTEAENTVNTHVVYDTNATDPDSDTITYSLSGGSDNNFFNINASTGEVTFKVSPNFEAPGDAGGNNVYDITVHANDGHGHDVTQAVAITVTNVNEFPPVINSNGGGDTASINVAENTTAVTTVTATDADAGSTLTYSLAGGLDAAKFSINSTTGALSFVSAPDFEAPTDNGTNNVYNVNVRASDGTNTDTQAISVTVTNAANEPPLAVADHVISNFGGTTYSVPEWAFLSNDSDPDGNAIDVNSVTNGSGLTSVGHAAGVGTNGTIDINDNSNGSDGNTFTYNDTDGLLVGNSATVTVDNKNGGDLTGTANADILVGDDNGNTFNGLGGNDIILAGGGNDTIIADQNDLVIDGGSGTDTLSVGANFTSTSDAQIVNIENVLLTAAVTLNLANQTEGFTITGSAGADSITGGAGNDTIVGAQNDTLLAGGGGNDTLSLAANFNDTGDRQITGIENILLTGAVTLILDQQTEGFNITGSAGVDTITGGSGNDTIFGAQNDTLLAGGGGNDTLSLAANFNDTGDGQITGIENIALTSAATLSFRSADRGV